jgi:hypothetical protein
VRIRAPAPAPTGPPLTKMANIKSIQSETTVKAPKAVVAPILRRSDGASVLAVGTRNLPHCGRRRRSFRKSSPGLHNRRLARKASLGKCKQLQEELVAQ